ncbi:hypothetical protein SAMN05720781_0770 [Fibrobacter sp. UWT3]|jgi:hypothetical protein|uniref:hypothetical protein n=1 Tax=Fibrobacter sp. UWT3 TaxID=1896225 RepID=UPI000BDB98FD|nr:hypothetical protein [Fibrobacter sp. UWT3]SOE54507.1 hypothetical protein SAMN05720781_0770 [Fibrobacter sp. UWT3]
MRLLMVILLVAVSAFSQVVITVDENVSKNQDKSLWLALGASALLPGMGELYLDERTLVKPFVWTDAALWLTAIGSYFIGERYITSAHGYAVRHAGLTTDSKDVSLLNTVGDYRSRGGVAGQNSSPDMDEDYNQAMIRAGKAIDDEYSESIQWDWGSSDNPESTERIEEYKSRLRHFRVSRIVFQVSVGALVLNRVVSILDVMRVYRATSSRSFSQRMEFAPEFLEDGGGILMNVKF